MLRSAREVVINDHNYTRFIAPVVNGQRRAMGMIPRNFAIFPHGCYAWAKPFDLPLIPENEWQGLLDAQIAAKAQLSNIRDMGKFGGRMPSTDQDGVGYCTPPDTLILMEDGTEKRIDTIAIGDVVRTAEGRTGVVKQLHTRHYLGEMVDITTNANDRRLLLTPNHEVLAFKEGYLPSEQLSASQRVACFTRGDRLWSPTILAVRRAHAGMVHNIGVDGDNSYIANGVGVHNCWCHSGTSATLLVRALNNQPFKSLSAFMVGCLIKNYRDQGGWGPAGLEFMVEHGIPEEKYWPQRSMSRSNDTPEMRANAKRHRVQEWMDLDPRNMKAQLVTCLLNNIPVVSDFNWWGHSVCTVDLVSLNPFRTRIWNSWSDNWSEAGMGILEGSKAIPSDAIAPRVVIAGLWPNKRASTVELVENKLIRTRAA